MEKPNHIALVMDGNRRWAKQKNLPTQKGHAAGVDALEKVVRAAVKNGIKFLTVYALSTENIKEREKAELTDLFGLIREGLAHRVPILINESVRLKFFGDIKKLPLTVATMVKTAEFATQSGKKLQLNIALNYGSRAEILVAVKSSKTKPLDEKSFSQLLFTKGIPDPDLIIRTGGQKRLSNFLLWQAAYSELYFTDTLWPDFGGKDLEAAIEDFGQRKRNFGA